MTNDLVVEPDFDQLDPNDADTRDLVASAGAMQQVRGSYTTAVSVQQPRVLQRARKRLIEESTMAGESFYYGWGAGKDKIEGASVKLAMAAARCWGNCVVETLPVQETADSWIFTSAFVDLETGFTLTRQFRQSKRWTVYGKHDQERKDDIRFQIGQSKAARNVILNALPEWLIDEAVEQAKAGVRQKIAEYVKKNGLPAAVDLVVKGLEKAGVGESLILGKCEVAARTGLTLDHLVMLRGDLAAIQGGQERAETLFPGPTDESASKRRSSLNDTIGNGSQKAEEKSPASPTAAADDDEMSPDEKTLAEIWEKMLQCENEAELDAYADIAKFGAHLTEKFNEMVRDRRSAFKGGKKQQAMV